MVLLTARTAYQGDIPKDPSIIDGSGRSATGVAVGLRPAALVWAIGFAARVDISGSWGGAGTALVQGSVGRRGAGLEGGDFLIGC